MFFIFPVIAQPVQGVSASGSDFLLEVDKEASFVNIHFLLDVSRWQEAGGEGAATMWFVKMLQRELRQIGAVVNYIPAGFQPSSAFNPQEVGYCSAKIPDDKFPLLLNLLAKIEQNKFNYHAYRRAENIRFFVDSLLVVKLSRSHPDEKSFAFTEFSPFRKAAYFRQHKIQPYLHIYLYGNFDTLDFLQQIPLAGNDPAGERAKTGRKQNLAVQKTEAFASSDKQYFWFELPPSNHLQAITLQWLDDMLHSIFTEINPSVHTDIFYPYTFGQGIFLLALENRSFTPGDWQRFRTEVADIRLKPADCFRSWYRNVYIPRLKFIYDNPSQRAARYLLSGLYFSDAAEIFRVYTEENLPVKEMLQLSDSILANLLTVIAEKK